MPPAGSIPHHNIPAHHLSGTSSALEAGSSCHQCKSRRAYYELIYCTQQQRKKKGSAPTAPIGCRKKYCEHCLLKFYQESRPNEQGLKVWTCPSCRHECSCAACRKKGEENGGQWLDDRPRNDRNKGHKGYDGGSTTSTKRGRRAAREEIDYDDPYHSAIRPISEQLPQPPRDRTRDRGARAAAALAQLQQQQHGYGGTNSPPSSATTFTDLPPHHHDGSTPLTGEVITHPLSPTTGSSSMINPNLILQHLDSGISHQQHNHHHTSNTSTQLGGGVGQNNNHLGNSPSVTTSTFSFNTSTGLQSPTQTSSLIPPHHHFNLHDNTHPRPPLFSTAHHLNQLKNQQQQQQLNQHNTQHHPQQQQQQQQQSQHHNHHQQHHSNTTNNLGNATVQSGPAAASAQISPHLQPLFKPAPKSPTLLPTSSTSLSLKGSPPFNAVSLAQGKHGGLGSTSNTPNLSQLTSKLTGGFTNSLFDPYPNPLLSSLINANQRATATGGSGGGNPAAPSLGGHHNTTNNNTTSHSNSTTTSSHIHSPKTSSLNSQLRTAAIGVASPAFQPADTTMLGATPVGASPKMGPSHHHHHQHANTGNPNSSNSNPIGGNNNNPTVPTPLDFTGFASPLIQGFSHGFSHNISGAFHHPQLNPNHKKDNIDPSTTTNTNPNNSTTTLSQPPLPGMGSTNVSHFKSFGPYNPASSIFQAQNAPNSGLFASLPSSLGGTSRLINNLSKDTLSLSANPAAGSIAINVNGNHLFSLNGQPLQAANLNDSNGLLQAKANILGLMHTFPDISSQPPAGGSTLGTTAITTTSIPQSPSTTATKLFKPNSQLQQNQTFASLHPSQQTHVLVTTLLGVLQEQNTIAGIQAAAALAATTGPTATTTTTAAAIPGTPTMNDGSGDSVSALFLQNNNDDDESPSENVAEMTHSQLKDSLDGRLRQLQHEHQSLLGLIDKTAQKLSKNGNKNEKAEYIELIKHLTTGLKRVQTEISNVQYRLDLFAMKRPQMVSNETIVALFALLWTMAHTPQVHSQLSDIAQQNVNVGSKLAKIYALFLANVSQSHQLQTLNNNSNNNNSSNNNTNTTSNNKHALGDDSILCDADFVAPTSGIENTTAAPTSGLGSDYNNPLSGLGIDLLTSANHSGIATLLGFSLGQSKAQVDSTGPSSISRVNSSVTPVPTTTSTAITTKLGGGGAKAQQYPSSSTTTALPPTPMTDLDQMNLPGARKRKATAEMDLQLNDAQPLVPQHPARP